ncbi:RcpC/CpaB family pilus assembly protein [Catenulispora pinisilvae]|uniref:RcpC/CpaB family pilus assembly protein n=1 Tax=Catenulispora pinisilvae TaxID=2705253 RepID=UPI0018918165|nr:RcpC/CpaB family pilus assembly protein [Catenulispora pinisilvae]
MPTPTTTRPKLIVRLTGRRHSSRTRRLRVLGAAGFAGVSMALLTAEHSAPPPRRPPRFAAESLMSGLVAVPVRFADPGSTGYLRPGDRIDVLAARDGGPGGPPGPPDALAGPAPGSDPGPPRAETAVAMDVSVLEIAHSADAGSLTRSAPDDGGLVFLAVDNATAVRLARAAVADRLSYALRHD